MLDMQYTYLVWSLILLLIWLVVFAVQKPQRKKMLAMSIGTAPLELSEPLFYPEYWFPLTLFRLGETTGFDIESLIFSAMVASHPGFVALYWNYAKISGIQVAGIPVAELVFAFSLGAMWSAFYEHRHWLRARSL